MDRMQECINDCLDCFETCVETKSHCLEMGGEHASLEHIQALDDCIEMCKTSAHFMMKESALHNKVCEVCAEACRICAESCEAFPEDEQMNECAEICRECEKSCQEMAERKQ